MISDQMVKFSDEEKCKSVGINRGVPREWLAWSLLISGAMRRPGTIAGDDTLGLWTSGAADRCRGAMLGQ
jgi:hypothetical protein